MREWSQQTATRTVKVDGIANVCEWRKISDAHSATVKHRTAEWTVGDWSAVIEDIHQVITLITRSQVEQKS